MNFERAPRLPAKARLTWQICRLRLDESGTVWRATASKGSRVAVVALPPLTSADSEAAWLETIEALFEAEAFDPTHHDYGGQPPIRSTSGG